MLLIATLLTAAGGCNNKKNSDDPAPSTKLVLPDYDAVKAEPFMINGWYAPEVTRESFEAYRECGFNYIFLQGHYTGAPGSAIMEEALTLCDELGIKAFVDITRQLNMIDYCAEQYVKHPSFAGFNYDEPVIYRNTLNNADGIVDIAPVVEKMIEDYPNIEFLVNLNPSTCTSFPWGTAPFTYEEYIDAQLTYINSIYENATCKNWISCDDYPLFYNPSVATPYYLKTTWLQNLEYLAEAKRDSGYKLDSNFFIQSMAYGDGTRNRKPTYEDIRLQVYTLLAFGYDSVSYFCYGTPPSGGEFTEEQFALVDRSGQKTDIWHSSKLVNEEIKKFENTYMQFNDNWLGVCPVIGSNNLAKDEYYYNKTMDSMENPLSVSRLTGVESVASDEDVIIGHMKDSEGNSGFMIVNYNDTTYNKKVNMTMTFKNFTKALVYQNGVGTVIDLTNNTLNVKLDIGEGVFVIPHG